MGAEFAMIASLGAAQIPFPARTAVFSTRTYGKIPEFENEEQRRNWLNNLKEIKNRVRSEMPPSYLDPDGPVMGYGHNREGYVTVTFLEGTVIEKPLMDEIYGMIDEEAEGMGIQEVPVIFKLGGLLQLDARDD